jgi:hypothetical protein
MPFSIHPYRRFSAQCRVTFTEGPFLKLPLAYCSGGGQLGLFFKEGVRHTRFKTKQWPDPFSESGHPDFPWRSRVLHNASAVAVFPSRRLRYSHFIAPLMSNLVIV